MARDLTKNGLKESSLGDPLGGRRIADDAALVAVDDHDRQGQ
jgi:hypothetical protein